ncbi:hypothetical protein GGI20_001061 [Coemansia sp. BCRC 34301]|nr:hypothetical protein GGI20_001061 [Coemansia sp. BCRC 34301]
MRDINPSIMEILKALFQNVHYEVIVGHANGQADLFLKVSTKDQDRELVHSSVAVEFKKLYSADKPLVPTNELPDWVVGSEMLTASYAQRLLRQLYGYMSQGSCRAPNEVRGTINPRYGIASDFNST